MIRVIVSKDIDFKDHQEIIVWLEVYTVNSFISIYEIDVEIFNINNFLEFVK